MGKPEPVEGPKVDGMKDKLLYAAVAALVGLAGGGWGGSALTEKTRDNAVAVETIKAQLGEVKAEQASVKTEVREKHAGVLDHLGRIEKQVDRIYSRLSSLHAKDGGQ